MFSISSCQTAGGWRSMGRSCGCRCDPRTPEFCAAQLGLRHGMDWSAMLCAFPRLGGERLAASRLPASRCELCRCAVRHAPCFRWLATVVSLAFPVLQAEASRAGYVYTEGEKVGMCCTCTGIRLSSMPAAAARPRRIRPCLVVLLCPQLVDELVRFMDLAGVCQTNILAPAVILTKQ